MLDLGVIQRLRPWTTLVARSDYENDVLLPTVSPLMVLKSGSEPS